MSTTPSLFAGIGAQFFNNSGVPLTGGLIYSYLSGTTTPVATYTTSAGSTAHTNPIVLDSAGRVPSGGEIWLLNGDTTEYKFVLKTSAAVLIATYDNVPGTYSATDLANTSNIDLGDALVGFKQSNPSGVLTGAVGKTVHDKLQDLVTVTDFGAVAGTDCAAQLVLASAATTGTVVIPNGAFVATATTSNSATILGLLSRIQINGTLTITVASGVHTFTSPVVVASNVVNGLSIVGASPVSLSITGQVSTSGATGAYSITLQASTVSNVAVGDFLHTCTVAGTGCPEIHRGVWEITNVDAINTRVTVKNTCRYATFPTNTITSSTSVALKSVLKFNSCDGFVVKDSCVDFLNNVAIVGNSDSYWSSGNVTGTELGTHGIIVGANTIAVNGKADNVNEYGISSASVSCGVNVGVNGFDQQGIVTELGGSFYGNFVSSCNNKRRGFYASTASGIRAKHISANGNYLDGVIADISGAVYASSVSCACGNGSAGISATSNGAIVFDTGITSFNNTNGAQANSGGFLQNTSSTCSNNLLQGIFGEYGAVIYCNNSTITNNGSDGLEIDFLSTARANTCTITGNGGYGIRSTEKSYITFTGSTLSTNTSGDYLLRNGSFILDSTTVRAGENYGSDFRIKNITTLKGQRFSTVSAGDDMIMSFDTTGAAGTGTYTTRYHFRDTTEGFYPETDGTYKLGRAANRWGEVFAANGTINTSDQREKQQVRDLNSAERAVAVKVKGLIKAFKFNDAVTLKGDNARIHFGVMAQQVKEAFESEDLVAESYGLLCYDEWDEQPEILENVLDADGKPTGQTQIVQSHRLAGNRYGIRYEQLLAFMIAAL